MLLNISNIVPFGLVICVLTVVDKLVFYVLILALN